jgi:glycosyltransferase involved in cell wall biosynthesis
VAERCRELDALVPVSRWYAGVMTDRLSADPALVRPVMNGLRLDDFEPADGPPVPPAVGYLARMHEVKGLATLTDAFLEIMREGRAPDLRLRIAGTRTGADRRFTKLIEERIREAGLEQHVDWLPNVTREEKIEFLRSLSVLSVPTTCGEAFGLYVIEAMAAGVPVVQPRHGAFPELIAETGGGVLCEPGDTADLARAITDLVLDPERSRSLGTRGRDAVLDRFTVARMAEGLIAVFEDAAAGRSGR